MSRIRSSLAVWVALALISAVGLATVTGGAAGQTVSGIEFADWTAVNGNSATGTLLGQPISLSGTNVPNPGSTVDGTSPMFSGSFWTPSLPASDAIAFYGHPGYSYVLQHGAGTELTLHIASLASTLEFPAGTQITRVSGDATFTVSGNTVSGAISGSADSNGTVRLSGVPGTIPFSATPTYPPGSADGIYVQVGAPEPVTPPPPPPSPPPAVQDLTPATPVSSGKQVSLTAAIVGIFSSLLWDLNGDGKPEITSLPGQDTLRFRPRPGFVTVHVQPVGQAGQLGASFEKTLFIPPVGNSRLEQRIGSIVTKQPVYAVGPKDTLGRPPRGFIGQYKLPCLARTTVVAGPLEIQGGCLRPITDVAEIPPAERGILDDVAKGLGVSQSSGYVANVNRALNLLDGYVGSFGDPVTVNGVKVAPRGNAAVTVLTQSEVIASSDAALSVGGINLGSQRRFVIDTAKRAGAIPLGSFPRIGGLAKLAGFGLVDDVSVTLAPPGSAFGTANIDVSLQLPAFLRNGPLAFKGRVQMRANGTDGLIVDNLRIGPASANLGALTIQKFQLDYKRGFFGEWRGQGEACVLSGPCLKMIPDSGGVVIAGNELRHAGATLDFNPNGIPLYPGVTLQHIGFFLGRDPTRMVAGAGIKVSGGYDIDGKLILALPTTQFPFVLDQGEVGPGFPGHFYGRRYTGITIGATGNASIDLPVFGRMSLGGAYFLYEYPSYIALGGGMDYTFRALGLDFLRVYGRVDGEFNATTGRFNLHGSTGACLSIISDDLCRGVTGNVSSRGVAACVEFGLSFGVGIIYSPFSVTAYVPPFTKGCRWSPYAEFDVRGIGPATAEVGEPLVVAVKEGVGRSVRLDGAGGAPRLRVTGPGGQLLESPAGSGIVERDSIRILRIEKLSQTIVAFAGSRPGTYRIEPLEGSPSVAKVLEAKQQLPPKVTAKVSGRGARRVLAYDVRRRLAQRVTFVEFEAGGAGKTIGTVNGGGRGTLPFTPAPGRGQHRIEAQFELAGLPAERVTVTRFAPPSARLARPAGLRVVRRGTSLRVSWPRVAEASAYEVAVTTSAGVQRLLRTPLRSITVSGIAKFSSGIVAVRGVATPRTGTPATARFRRTAPRPTRLRSLPRPSRALRGAR